jgi:hypothetical protein
MADQRRRGGRGRSGRGGRIPRKGEAQASTGLEETFVSFPLDVSGPLEIAGTIDAEAVEAILWRTLRRERRMIVGLEASLQQAQDPVLAEVRGEIERHRDALLALGRDLGADASQAEEPDPRAGEVPDLWDLVAIQRLARLGWLALQCAGCAAGDRRVGRVARPVLQEMERHAGVLETYTLREATRGLFRDPEE